jgi:hypothetical protein
MTALILVRRPLWGVFLVLLLSPIKTYGSEILMAARLIGLFTVAITLLRVSSQRKKIQWTGIEIPVLIMGLGISMSFFRTTSISPVSYALLSLASLYGLVLMIYNLVENEGQLKSLMMVYLFSGIVPIYQAFIQRAAGPTYVGQQYVRVSGTFSLATGLGAFLIPYTLIAASLLLYPGFSRLQKLFITGMFGASYTALIFSLSRGAFVGTFIGVGLLIFGLRSVSQNRRSGSPLAIVLATVVVLIITYLLWNSIQGRVLNPLSDLITAGVADEDFQPRNDEFRLLLNITLENHFIGTGIGNYPQNAMLYRYKYNAPSLPLVPHNLLLYLFGEAGIVMAAGFWGMVGAIFKQVHLSAKATQENTQNLVYLVWISSRSAFIGYSVFMITHSGLFTNEFWFSMAFLLVAIRLGGTMELQVSRQFAFGRRRVWQKP